MDLSLNPFIPRADEGDAITIPKLKWTTTYLRSAAKVAVILCERLGRRGESNRPGRQPLGEQCIGLDVSHLRERCVDGVSNAMLYDSDLIRLLSQSAEFLRDCSFPNSWWTQFGVTIGVPIPATWWLSEARQRRVRGIHRDLEGIFEEMMIRCSPPPRLEFNNLTVSTHFEPNQAAVFHAPALASTCCELTRSEPIEAVAFQSSTVVSARFDCIHFERNHVQAPQVLAISAACFDSPEPPAAATVQIVESRQDQSPRPKMRGTPRRRRKPAPTSPSSATARPTTLRLTAKDRRRTLALVRNGKDVRQVRRAQIILLLAKSWTHQNVSDATSASRSTVGRVRRRFETVGFLSLVQ
jgi:hypothetical protein